jgi:hypothetical protein
LCAEARSYGKLAADFVIPAAWRDHLPTRLDEALQPFRRKGLLSTFPFGSDFDEIEQQLLPALDWLKSCSGNWRGRWRLLRAAVRSGGATEGEDAALARMGLDVPKGLASRMQRRLLQAALRQRS